MKKGKKNFTISNRVLYTLITLGILAILAVGVYAYGSGSPTTFGHSGDEINVDNTFCTRISGHNCGYDTDTDTDTDTPSGLYGYCLMRYKWTGGAAGQGTATSECRDSKSPAYCSGYCGCNSGYTMVTLTGGAGVPTSSTSPYTWYTFACYKN